MSTHLSIILKIPVYILLQNWNADVGNSLKTGKVNFAYVLIRWCEILNVKFRL